MASNFTSFVDYDEEKPRIAVSSQLTTPTTVKTLEFFKRTQIKLLPQEIESCSCENVTFSMNFDEGEQGNIICTKVRLRFTPAMIKERDLPQKSKFFDDFYDVPLCSIAKIMVALVKNPAKGGKSEKFQRMEHNYSSMETISMIRLMLKDFRVVTIDLKRSQNGTHLANQIMFFANCGSIEKMEHVGAGLEKKGKMLKIPFNGYDEWHAELQRCQLKTDSSAPWRICALQKEGFNYSADGYPMYVVLPTFLAKQDINRFLQNWKNGRIPIWTWSRQNGSAALLISGEPESNIAIPELKAKLSQSLSRCHASEETPHSIHLDSDFVHQIGKAYDHLINLCAVDSEKFDKRQIAWHTKVQRTGWVQLVRNCLNITNDAIQWIMNRDRTVILYEDEGRDLSILVASLVQICCDPYYRTTLGFQQLIEKMWIGLGHPFGQRLLGRDSEAASKRLRASVTKGPNEKTDVFPTWLMFLDCCAQLQRIHPFSFTFSHHYLIGLWDLSITGIVPGLSCNNIEEQLACQVSGGPTPIELYFESDYTILFDNVWHDAKVFMDAVKNHHQISPASMQNEVIRPPTTIAEVELWMDCYMRWIPEANYRNSGKLSELEVLDRRMMDLAKKTGREEWRQHFCLPKNYSSAYPYSLPQLARPMKNSMDDSFEMIQKPLDFDNTSIDSSFSSLTFTQTPVGNPGEPIFPETPSRNAFSYLAESPGISLKPKLQTVSFSKYELEETPPKAAPRTVETPILSQSIQPPTPARRNTVQSSPAYRPTPPPRPTNLKERMNSNQSTNNTRISLDQSDDGDMIATVTRF